MSQVIFSTINPATTSGTQLATILTDFRNAYMSGNSGTARPSGLAIGGYWVDTTQAGSPNFLLKFKLYDGTTDVEVFTVNSQTGSASISGSSDQFAITRTSDDNNGAILSFLKSRIADDGQVLEDDSIGIIQVSVIDENGDPQITGNIEFVATQDQTAAAQGNALVFRTTTTAEATLTEVARFADSKMGVGINTPDVTIHALGTGIKSQKNADDALGAKISTRKKRITGTGAAQSTDVIGNFDFNSTDENGAEITGATVEAAANENHSTTTKGTTLRLRNVNTGATALTTKIELTDVIENKVNTYLEALAIRQQDVATAATITSLSGTKALVNFTGSTATDVQGIDASTSLLTKVIVIHNGSSANVTLKHQNLTATANNRLKLPNSADIIITPDSSSELFYSVSDSRWKVKAASGAARETVGASLALTASASVTISAAITAQTFTVASASGEVALSTTPFGSTVPLDGTRIRLIGTSDDNFPTITADDSSKGAVGNFSSISLTKYMTADFQYISSLDRWVLC